MIRVGDKDDGELWMLIGGGADEMWESGRMRESERERLKKLLLTK